MNHKVDVLVIGGGIVGLSAALAMAQKQFSVALLDAGSLKVDPCARDLRVYAINHASQQLLQKLNVWSRLDLIRLSPYRHMHIWDASNRGMIEFDSRDIAASNLGWIIEESVLKQALLEQIATHSSIQLFPHHPVDMINSSTQGLQIKSQQQTWEGQLAMLADGANSSARQHLKVDMTTWSYHQHAIIGTIQTEKPHQATAYQVFTPSGPLALLPLSSSNQCAMVWSADSGLASTLMAMSDETFNQELNKTFTARLGRLEIISPRHQFPLTMRHVKQYIGHHWMLLGDAAHTIHPLAGLGLNLGLADVLSWMNCLANRKGCFTSSQLNAYQRERKHAVWQTILLMEGFKRLFGHHARSVSTLRGLGLSCCNELSPLKRLFIQHAAGR